jgi:hypothetical protein
VSQLQPFLGAAGNAASGVAGVDTGLGNALNQNQQNLGQAQLAGQMGIGNAQANADLSKVNTSANLLGALAGGAKAAAGSSGLGSSLLSFLPKAA